MQNHRSPRKSELRAMSTEEIVLRATRHHTDRHLYEEEFNSRLAAGDPKLAFLLNNGGEEDDEELPPITKRAKAAEQDEQDEPDYDRLLKDAKRKLAEVRQLSAGEWVTIPATKLVGPAFNGMHTNPSNGKESYRYALPGDYMMRAPPAGLQSRNCVKHSVQLVKDVAIEKLVDYCRHLEAALNDKPMSM